MTIKQRIHIQLMTWTISNSNTNLSTTTEFMLLTRALHNH